MHPHGRPHGASGEEPRHSNIPIQRMALQQSNSRIFMLDRHVANQQVLEAEQPFAAGMNRMAVQQPQQMAAFLLDRNVANQQVPEAGQPFAAGVNRMAAQQRSQAAAFLLEQKVANQQANQNRPIFPAPTGSEPSSGHPSGNVNAFEPLQSPNPIYRAAPTAASGIYAPLLSADSFRLLQILPDSEGPVRCSLRAYRLSENEGTYEALSYTWTKDGSTEDSVQVLINDFKLIIGRNLYDALHRLRSENKARTVWADAICINQDNYAEKSQQVKMMGSIFAKAWRVVVWLGTNEDANPYRQERLRSVSKTISLAFSGVCSIVNWWLRQKGHHSRKAEYTCPVSGQVSGEAVGDGVEFNDTLVNSIFPLFKRGWFSRTWVIQEAALARSVIVLWGGYEISWDWVGLAAAITKDNLSDSSLSRMQSSVSEYQSIPVGVINAYFMYRISGSQTFLEPLQFSFLQLLQLTRKFGCKSGHDRIYALIGLPTNDATAERIIPDYERTISLVYEDLARLILESDTSLAILSSVGHNLVLPSWVPTWHLPAPDSLRPMMPHVEFQCGTSVARQINLSDDKSTLEVQGVIVDEIATIFSAETNSFCWNYAPSTISHHPPASAANKTMSTREAFQTLAMTLTGGLDWRGYPVDVDTNLANFASAFLSQAMNWRALDKILRLINLSHAFSGQTLSDLEKLARDGESAPYVNAVRATFFSHVIFVTKSGMIGVGPSKDIQPGDQLAVLLGANVPFLLRPAEIGYRVVGECYCYNVMHGEALRRLSDTEQSRMLHERWLTLV